MYSEFAGSHFCFSNFTKAVHEGGGVKDITGDSIYAGGVSRVADVRLLESHGIFVECLPRDPKTAGHSFDTMNWIGDASTNIKARNGISVKPDSYIASLKKLDALNTKVRFLLNGMDSTVEGSITYETCKAQFLEAYAELLKADAPHFFPPSEIFVATPKPDSPDNGRRYPNGRMDREGHAPPPSRCFIHAPMQCTQDHGNGLCVVCKRYIRYDQRYFEIHLSELCCQVIDLPEGVMREWVIWLDSEYYNIFALYGVCNNASH